MSVGRGVGVSEAVGGVVETTIIRGEDKDQEAEGMSRGEAGDRRQRVESGLSCADAQGARAHV